MTLWFRDKYAPGSGRGRGAGIQVLTAIIVV